MSSPLPIKAKTLKQKLGIDLNDIFEGYVFRRKEGELFVFGNEDHEVSFTLDVVRRSLHDRFIEERTERLQTQLKFLGISRLSFQLPHQTFSTQLPLTYTVVRIEDDELHVWMRAKNGDERRVSISMLHELQAHIQIADLKRLESDFPSLPLDFILRRVDELTLELNYKQYTGQGLSAHLVLTRIRILISERLSETPEELYELEEESLKRLSMMLESGITSIDVDQSRQIYQFTEQLSSVEQRREVLRELSCLDQINEEKMVEVFAPNELRARLLRLISKPQDLSERLIELADEWYERVSHLTSLSFKRERPHSFTLDSFVQFLFEFQDRYLNSQLRVGKNDLHLINRFQIQVALDKLTYPILKDYHEITRSERLILHRELQEHRLNLIFFKQIQDQSLRLLAQNNVNDFYALFYKHCE